MPLAALRAALPACARDVAETLRAAAADEAMGERRRWGCLLAGALAAGEPTTLEAVREEAPLAAADRRAAEAAAAVTGMNAVYYRAVSLMKAGDYATLPSQLSLEVLRTPGADRLDFEMWCLAVAAMLGCGVCLDAHDAELRANAVQPREIQVALRIAAATAGAAQVLRAEAASKGGDRGDAAR